MSKSVDMWTQSHDGGRRFGAMTTNILECFNGVLKGAQGLPIVALVEFTWNKLVQYFHDRHKEYHYELSEGKKWSEYALSTWDGNKRKSKKHYLKPFGNEELIFQVVTQLNTIVQEGETTVMKFGYRKEHTVVGNGKTQGSLVHMQLEYVTIYILIQPHIFTYVMV